MAIKSYSTTPGSNNSAAPNGAPEGMAPSGVNDTIRQIMADIRSDYDNREFRDWGHTVTRTGNTTFTIATDVTAIYVVNRPIRCTDSSTLYGYVSAVSYGAPNTTVTVTLDSGNLSASLTAVALGVEPTYKSIHVSSVRNAVSVADNNTFSGDNDIKDTLEIYDPTDTTKKIRLDAGSVTTGTTRVVTVPDRDITLADPLTSGTAIATTSGTSHDFTGIPSWVKRITVAVSALSTNGTSAPILQLGDSGGIEATGYLCGVTADGAASNFTTGIGLSVAAFAATYVISGTIEFVLLDAATNTWVASGTMGRSDAAAAYAIGGTKSLTAALDRIRLTTVNGTDAFDAGSVNILYE